LLRALERFSATKSTPPVKVRIVTLRPREMPLRASSERSRSSWSTEE
jgi:hypothetical protein